jgi:flavin-binding protein dodecin
MSAAETHRGGAGIPERCSVRSRDSRRKEPMPGTYKKIEIVGTSTVSFADAVKAAVSDASKTIRNMDWFEMVEMRGRIKNGQVAEFQVTVRIGFKLER